MKYITLALALLISACTTTSKTTTSDKSAEEKSRSDTQSVEQQTRDELKNEFASNLMVSMIRQNGQNLACKLESFTTCWGVTEQKCLEDAIPVKQQCIAYIDSKVDAPTTEVEAKQYAKIFTMCMISKQSMLYPEKVTEMKSCLSQYERPDPKVIAESILNPKD